MAVPVSGLGGQNIVRLVTPAGTVASGWRLTLGTLLGRRLCSYPGFQDTLRRLQLPTIDTSSNRYAGCRLLDVRSTHDNRPVEMRGYQARSMSYYAPVLICHPEQELWSMGGWIPAYRAVERAVPIARRLRQSRQWLAHHQLHEAVAVFHRLIQFDQPAVSVPAIGLLVAAPAESACISTYIVRVNSTIEHHHD